MHLPASKRYHPVQSIGLRRDPLGYNEAKMELVGSHGKIRELAAAKLKR